MEEQEQENYGAAISLIDDKFYVEVRSVTHCSTPSVRQLQ